MIEIVTAKACHAEFIADAQKRYIDCPWTTSQIKDEIADEKAIFLVATDGGEPIGFLSGVCAADECEISNIAVEQNYRRRGVASTLFHELIARAKARGVRRVFLLVRENNEAAAALYARLGFKAIGMRRNYYGVGANAILMSLDLGAEG